MPYKNSKNAIYYLHGRHVTLRNGHRQIIYYFASKVDPATRVVNKPAGYEVAETKNGLPVLRKTKKDEIPF